MQPTEEIETLRQEVASLLQRLDQLETPAATTSAGAVTRRGLLMGLAGASAAAVAGVAAADPAAAADGNPLLLGSANTASTTTQLANAASTADPLLVVSGTGTGAIEAHSTKHGSTVIATNEGSGVAVHADNDSFASPAIVAINSGEAAGIGVQSLGGGPQLWLSPDVTDGVSAVGPPVTDAAFTGSIRVDANGDIWLCTYGPTDGPTTPAWTRLAREDTGRGLVFPIRPTRMLDTRATGGRPAGSPAVPGQKKGPLKGGTGVTLDLAEVAGIPEDAQAVIGNLTVTAPTFGGYLRAFPAGSPSTSSALNWVAGATVGNAFTCQLGPAGLSLVASGVSSQSYHLVVDVTAYVA